MKILKGLVVFVLLTNYMYGYYGQKERTSTLKEYKMMKLCIDDQDTILTSYVDARDNCACAIEKLPNRLITQINKLQLTKGVVKQLEEILNNNYKKCDN